MVGVDDLAVFPRPRRLVAHGRPVPRDAVAVVVQDQSLAREAFVVEVDGSILVRHRDDAGRRYGLDVVAQLRAQCPRDIPGLRLEDAPDFAVRGYMLDISRDRVPTRATLERLVGLMRQARLNHLELYIEHTFAYAAHGVVWAAASPLDADDVHWLDELCAGVGIELVANQNCFGHFERWLAHEQYRPRAECPDGYEFLGGSTAAPSTLAPTPANAAFVLDLLHELLPNFSSRRVHIGCDEPFELGLGASAAAVAAQGKATVFLEHVRRIAEPLVAEGREVLVWADVLRHAPGLAAEMPPGVVPVAWNYEAPGLDVDALPEAVVAMLDRIGVDLRSHTGFEANVAPLVEAGLPMWVAPGTSSWNSFVGRIDNAVANLLDAAEVGRRNRARGFLVTDWGDNGHLQPPSVSFAPLLFGGAVSWGLDANRSLDPAELLDMYAFEDPDRRLGAAVVELATLWGRTGQQPFNASPLHAAVVRGAFCLATGHLDVDRLREVVTVADAAIDTIGHSTPRCADADVVRDELIVAARLARRGAEQLLARSGAGVAPSAAELSELVADQRRVWSARARPGGLDDAVARLGA